MLRIPATVIALVNILQYLDTAALASLPAANFNNLPLHMASHNKFCSSILSPALSLAVSLCVLPPGMYLTWPPSVAGVAAMEAANWDAAAAAFAGALTTLGSEPPSSSRSERAKFAAQYLAAVMLLKAAGADSSAKGARLYRY